jgi:hypothetical protein
VDSTRKNEYIYRGKSYSAPVRALTESATTGTETLLRPAGKVAATAATVLLAVTLGARPAAADPVVPMHAIVVCQSASFYANYDSSSGPVGLKRTLYYGNKIGHTPGVHPVYNGWAASFDFGPNDWGYLRIECIGGYNSW